MHRARDGADGMTRRGNGVSPGKRRRVVAPARAPSALVPDDDSVATGVHGSGRVVVLPAERRVEGRVGGAGHGLPGRGGGEPQQPADTQDEEHAVPLKNGEALEPVTEKSMVSALPAGPL